MAARPLTWFLETLSDPRVFVSAALLWLGWIAERRRVMADFQRTFAERAAHRQRTCDVHNSNDAVAEWFEQVATDRPPRPLFTGIGWRRIRALRRRSEGNVAPGSRMQHHLAVQLMVQPGDTYVVHVAPLAGTSPVDAFAQLARLEQWPEPEASSAEEWASDDPLMVRVQHPHGDTLVYVTSDPAFRTPRRWLRVARAVAAGTWAWLHDVCGRLLKWCRQKSGGAS